MMTVWVTLAWVDVLMLRRHRQECGREHHVKLQSVVVLVCKRPAPCNILAVKSGLHVHAGKTLLARAIASNIDANFLKVVSSAVVDKYIGESARLIREMFGYAKEHQPCIIFMDEIDAIGGKRFSEGTSADREIQRTLMELLSQLDGFDVIGKVSPFQLHVEHYMGQSTCAVNKAACRPVRAMLAVAGIAQNGVRACDMNSVSARLLIGL